MLVFVPMQQGDQEMRPFSFCHPEELKVIKGGVDWGVAGDGMEIT